MRTILTLAACFGLFLTLYAMGPRQLVLTRYSITHITQDDLQFSALLRGSYQTEQGWLVTVVRSSGPLEFVAEINDPQDRFETVRLTEFELTPKETSAQTTHPTTNGNTASFVQNKGVGKTANVHVAAIPLPVKNYRFSATLELCKSAECLEKTFNGELDMTETRSFGFIAIDALLSV